MRKIFRLPVTWLFFIILIFLLIYVGLPIIFGSSYELKQLVRSEESQKPPKPPVTHLKTPEPVKGIYMTSCVAGTPSWRAQLKGIAEKTEINSIIIDIKDYSGTISIPTTNSLFKDHAATGCRVSDIEDFIRELHEAKIYVIGRITVFQDPYYSKLHPELAVKKKSDGSVWKDFKGLSFIDVGATPYWDYIVALSKDSFEIGFDELNFDYVRYPSDGNMKDIKFNLVGTTTKAEELQNFFEYLSENLKKIKDDKGKRPILSVDLFGMTTTNSDDLNIGQVIENAFAHFDYIAPMVYPSHYPPQFNGWLNPNEKVYDVVYYSMSKAVERLKYYNANIASTTAQMRPWLQDFDYGGNYGLEEVRAQIKATYDVGLTSWMLWDPANKYTRSALLPE